MKTERQWQRQAAERFEANPQYADGGGAAPAQDVDAEHARHL